MPQTKFDQSSAVERAFPMLPLGAGRSIADHPNSNSETSEPGQVKSWIQP
jgi:hypothetical protein